MNIYRFLAWFPFIFSSLKSMYFYNEFNKQAQTEDSMRIECLHRDTGQVERQIHEKTHYQRRLEHMLTRLKTNQVNTFL